MRCKTAALACILFFIVSCAAAQSPAAKTKQVEMKPLDAVLLHKVQPVLSENFDRDPLKSWTFIGDAKPQSLRVGRALRTNGFAFGVWQTKEFQSFTLRLRYRHAHGIGDIVLRGKQTDPPQYLYHLLLANDRVAVAREFHQKQKELASADIVLKPGQWYNLGIEVTENRIQLTVNNKRVLTAHDPDPLPPGLVCLGSILGKGFMFDDVTIRPSGPPAEEPEGVRQPEIDEPPPAEPPPAEPQPAEPQQERTDPGKIDLGKVLEGIEIFEKPETIRIEPPHTLLIGDFTLAVEDYTNPGHFDRGEDQFVGVSGTAWVNFDCGGPILLPGLIEHEFEMVPAEDSSHHVFEIVERVNNPEKQISLKEARLIRPNAEPGEHIELELATKAGDSKNIVRAKDALIKDLIRKPRRGDALVRFDEVTIRRASGEPDVGRITAGVAAYPVTEGDPEAIQLSIDGFTALIGVLTLTADEATADIELILPRSIGSVESCGPATLYLGTTEITPDCEFYAQRPDEFGPWIIGDTSLIAFGNGYVADFSSSQSPAPRPGPFKGVILSSGTASGTETVSRRSNTGYLAADYSFTDAEITGPGFAGELNARGPHSFETINPEGYRLSTEGGSLVVSESKITSGQFGPGRVAVRATAVCQEAAPGSSIEGGFGLLTVQDDLDLSGEISFGSGIRISWGELTNKGEESLVWGLEVTAGYLYLPAGPKPTFSPDTGSGFLSLNLGGSLPVAVAKMEAEGLSGLAITSGDMEDIAIYSPDRPGGTTNPISLRHVDGWLRIGHRGIDGDIGTYEWDKKELLGDKTRSGYVGNSAFDATLNPAQKEMRALFQFATSAVYDSRIDGSIDVPTPCDIKSLEFNDMEATSTANLVGGNVMLPVGGVTLGYWQLDLVPTGDPAQAGVVSVRTGRLVFTAAGISEPVHFQKPFRLTWGEMLADGNLGHLFFDYNPYGQRFDGLNFSPHHIALSQYVPGATDGYLAASGSVYVSFFGSCFANIRDARHDAVTTEPYFGRSVTVPKNGEPGCPPTDLHLHGIWDDASGDRLATLDFPDAQMRYNEVIQQGFIGTGSAEVSFVHSDGLDATIEIHPDATDICLTSTTTHDLDFGLYTRLGSIGQITGCIRITGPTLERMVIGGYLEKSIATGTGIIEPKAASVVEIVSSVTPNCCTFYASGDMSLSVAASAVDMSGSVYLKRDWTRSSVEGDVNARINCNSVLAGLEGNGQVTWYIDPSIQYLQGRLGVTVCSWTGGAGLEGGMFIGHGVPKAKAWVLQTTTGRFGISQNQLPETLTGIYGYGQVSFGVQWYVFGGGVDLYAGMGAFSSVPAGETSAWSDLAGIGLPYVVGSAGVCVRGEILGGLVSASGWANLALGGPVPTRFEGKFGLEGCVLWVLCASVEVTAGLSDDGFYMF